MGEFEIVGILFTKREKTTEAIRKILSEIAILMKLQTGYQFYHTSTSMWIFYYQLIEMPFTANPTYIKNKMGGSLTISKNFKKV